MARAPAVRAAVATAEAALVLGLLLVWLLFPGVRTGRSLWILFFYSFPAEFLVGLLPHEPILLFYGEIYPALTVALVAAAGTLLAEAMNYSFVSYFNTAGLFRSMQHRRAVASVIALFRRAPFLAIVVAGATPIPFFPLRFLVVMAGYPVGRYLTAVFVARTPRFFLLAAIGHAIHFPAWSLVLIFVAMMAAIYLPLIRRRRQAVPDTAPSDLTPN